MAKLSTPLRLSPVFKEKIWGREDLSPLFPRAAEGVPAVGNHPSRRDAGDPRLYGEAWLTDDASEFMNGPVAGRALAEVSAEYGKGLWGAAWKGNRFPILAKYIFTAEWLSIQVHPDDEQARRYDPGSAGKSEMWYVAAAEANAAILLGLKPGVSKEQLRFACAEGSARSLLREWNPREQEALFVPPGTVHAIGPSLTLFETEQNSDLTYRLDDYGRPGQDGKPRPLHLDKGIGVTRVEAPAHRNLPHAVVREPFGLRRYVLACRHFAVEELTLDKTGKFTAVEARVEMLSVLQGAGRVETAAGWFGYHPGDTWLIPPGDYRYRLEPRSNTRMLKVYVPDSTEDWRRTLRRRRVKKTLLDRIIFD